MSASPSSEPETARFGRYEILGALDDTFGWTTRGAVDPESGRKVTLRWLPISGVPPETVAALLRDAQTLARVRHAGLLNVYDAGVHDDRLYLAQEPATGVPLPIWLTAKRRSWRDISRVFVALGSSVAALHAAGLVCRDLSLARVAIGRDRAVVLTDIGLSRALGGAPTLDTPIPEEARDARSDQLALAALFHAALFGFGAFKDGWSRADTTNARSIPRPLLPILDRALSVAPDKRFPSVAHFAGALHALVEHRPQAPRVLAAAAAAVLLALSAGVTVGAWLRNGTPFVSMARVLSNECEALDRSFDGVWDARRQEELGRAMWRTAGIDAAPPWALIRHEVSAWVSRWGAAHDQACLVPTGRAGQTLASDQRTLECLTQSRARLQLLLDVTPELGPRLTLVGLAQLGAPEACPTTPADLWLGAVRRGSTRAGPDEGTLEGRAAFEWADGSIQSAIETLERAVATYPEDLADERVATALATRGRMHADARSSEDATTALTRALRMRERVSGPDDGAAAALWHDLGVVAARRGAAADAVLHHRKALGIRERAAGESSLEVASSLRAIGMLERAAERSAEAVESHRRALAMTIEGIGEESGEAATASIELGWALIDAGKAGEASERFFIAERTAQRLAGRASRLVARALEGRGVAELTLNASAKAVDALEEAVFILETVGGDADQRARTKFHLATALIAEGKDRPRALRLASTARERLIERGDADLATAVSRWIEAATP